MLSSYFDITDSKLFIIYERLQGLKIIQNMVSHGIIFLLFYNFYKLFLSQGPNSLGTFKKTLMSKAALTHKFRKLRSPTKCRDCEGIVVFQGVECEEVRSLWNCVGPFMLFVFYSFVINFTF